MSFPACEEAAEKSLPAETIGAERLRSSIMRATSNSTEELKKLTTELERLQEFLKSETERVQREIEGVLDGIGIIIEAIAPWKASAQNTPAANGRDTLKVGLDLRPHGTRRESPRG